MNNRSWFSRVAPGILLAATGVGAGDILTTSLAGSEVGLTLLWAVAGGALLKFVLTGGNWLPARRCWKAGRLTWEPGFAGFSSSTCFSSRCRLAARS